QPRHGKNEPYLLYGLKYRDYAREWTVFIDDSRHGDYQNVYLKGIKPILRPLSDLTKEIEHNSISIKLEPELESVIPMLLISKHYHYTSREDGHISYHIGDGTCIGSLYYSVPYALIQLLFEWHFDVFGLIDKG